MRSLLTRLLGGVLLAGCAAALEAGPARPGVERLADPPGIHNLFALGTNLFSGSAPEGDAGFAALARLGVKTIITVDGTTPEVERARKLGMRYVHLPHGYDGIAPEIQLRLIQAARTLPGPIYLHCHHGEHRGPAAAAVICLAEKSLTGAEAEQWLHAAGTSTNYAGLYRTVREFEMPSAARLAAVGTNFPEIARVSGLVESMVRVDQLWDTLRAIRAAGYRAPADHPDLDPRAEAVLLWEQLREARRLPDAARHGPDFLARLEAAETLGRELQQILPPAGENAPEEIRARLDRNFDEMKQSCTACHKRFRDVAAE